MTKDTQKLIDTRGGTHGSWSTQAGWTQSIKTTINAGATYRVANGQKPLTAGQRDALDMIAVKMGRILAGDADFQDHWDDIAGYAKLGGGATQKKTTPSIIED